MQIGRSNTIPDPKYTLVDCLLPNLTSAEDLGVIDFKLNFNTHISIITGIAHARAYLSHKCCIFRNTQSLVRRFVSYVRPILEYASSTWSSYTTVALRRGRQRHAFVHDRRRWWWDSKSRWPASHHARRRRYRRCRQENECC